MYKRKYIINYRIYFSYKVKRVIYEDGHVFNVLYILYILSLYIFNGSFLNRFFLILFTGSGGETILEWDENHQPNKQTNSLR